MRYEKVKVGEKGTREYLAKIIGKSEVRLGEKREWLKEQDTEADEMRRTMEYLGILCRET